jgi:Tol biopolymer transport system component/DNA-binding winged helix-turn-helix (wHTH) protein
LIFGGGISSTIHDDIVRVSVGTSRSASVCARFDRFQIDLTSGELHTSAGTSVRIQQQPRQVLRLLLEAEGGVVTREQLRVALWPDDTFVDFEHGVNTAVKKLRQALGDSVENPEFVETVPKVGYRFLVPVEWVTDLEDKRQPHTIPRISSGAAPVPQPERWRRLLTRRNALVIGFIPVVVLALLVLFRSQLLRSKAPEPSITLAVTSVGEKYSPSLSPGGKQLAFAWNGGNGPYFSVYVKLIGTEEPLRLTKQESVDYNPVWSPDGRYIAFCRIQKGDTGIYIVPALGGAERKVRETHWEEREFYEVFWYFGRLSWSPDGKLLAFSDRTASNGPTSILLLSLDTLAARRLTSPGIPGDYNPVFSPDGKTLAFNRGSQGVTSIYTVPVAGGEERRLITGPQFGWGLAWAPDGRNIVFGRAGWLATSGWLWKISRYGGEPERLQFGQEGTEPSIRGNRLVYARQVTNLSIWKRKLDSLPSLVPAERFLSSTTIESGPQFSPDGSRIVLESTRSGAYEVWECRNDGSNLVQLTHLNSVTGTPRWSPDGQRIAFDSRAPGNADIFVMDSRGGSLRNLTNEASTDVVPSWSRDGRWIYFASDRSGEWQVWKMPSAGGPAVQVTRHGGYGGFESLDGKYLYYTKGATVSGIWRIPTAGSKETEVIGSLEAGYWGYWAVVKNGIYYLETTDKPAIAFFDFTTQGTTKVFELENRPAREVTGMAVSQDGGTILYTQLDALSRDIVLVENFR